MQELSEAVKVIEGNELNLKLTTELDLRILEVVL
jgi:2-C-methyl-D-erythritol 4-phosphate cytidylyltransferase